MPPAIGLATDDPVRFAEACRLATALGDGVWAGWSRVPMALLLVTSDHEYLLRHPRPSNDFARVRVMSAANGVEVLERIGAHQGRIDLLVTDIVMPMKGGRELVEQLNARGTPRRVLLISGYTDDEVMRRGLLEPGCAFLPKPFGLDAFQRKVGEVLDAAHHVSPTLATGDDRAA